MDMGNVVVVRELGPELGLATGWGPQNHYFDRFEPPFLAKLLLDLLNTLRQPNFAVPFEVDVFFLFVQLHEEGTRLHPQI